MVRLPAAVAAVLVSGLLCAGVPEDIDGADLAAFVDGFVSGRMHSEQVVGVTVSVVHGGELIFARGYGHDDLAAGRPVEAARSLFRPGSISKTFTWTAIMQLVEQGRLDLDADIQTYLPDLEIAQSFAEPITLNHLMAHTPGYEESVMGHLFADDPAGVLPLVEYLRDFRPRRVRPPGVLPAYSNYGVAVAGHIVASVSGLPWETYVEQHIFEPLGMNDSTFREPWTVDHLDPMPARLRQNMSKGYVRRGGAYHAGDFTFIGHVSPAGALSTTATDMARWMLAHLNLGRLGDARVLDSETARRMQRQHHTMDPQMPGMAHGFIESHIHGYRAIGHGGGTIHFLSDMQLVPDLGLGVFISVNTTGGGGLIDEFVAALVERYFPAGPFTIPPAAVAAEAGRPLAEYAGSYLPSRRPFTSVERMFLLGGASVSAPGDGGLLVAGAGGEYRLEPLGGDSFRNRETGQRVTFTSDPDGAINAILVPVPVLVLEKVGPFGNPSVLYGILAAAGFILACAVVGAWLRRKRPLQQTPAEAWAARLLIVTALVWLAVFGLGAIGTMPMGSDFAAVFFEFPAPALVAALALTLPAAVLSVLSGLLLYPVWSTASWPLWRRLRHTGVVLAALATLLVLRNFNAIGFNYLAG
jgi:CubicO group peptidase (beta-lactamase class C family)